jgi:hypothetical protein
MTMTIRHYLLPKQKEPCINCSHKYKCEAERLACSQFRFFVETGRVSEAIHHSPTRAIYIDVFYKEPTMGKKEAA